MVGFLAYFTHRNIVIQPLKEKKIHSFISYMQALDPILTLCKNALGFNLKYIQTPKPVSPVHNCQASHDVDEVNLVFLLIS